MKTSLAVAVAVIGIFVAIGVHRASEVAAERAAAAHHAECLRIATRGVELHDVRMQSKGERCLVGIE